MANKYVAPRNGNKVDEEGLLLGFLNALCGSQNAGYVQTTAMQVTQASPTANMSVDIQVGYYAIPYLSYFFPCWVKVKQNLTVAASDPSNARWSRIIAYVDLSVADTTNANTPDGIKFLEVAGTPAGSPTVPSDATVQAAVGASNPWREIGRLEVDAAVTTILTAKITDERTQLTLGGGLSGIALPQSGPISVANDVAPSLPVPKAGFFTALYAKVKVAPVGSDLIGRVNKNGVSVTTFTITNGSLTCVVTGLSVSCVPGDNFSLDFTQVGSTTPGSSCTASLG